MLLNKKLKDSDHSEFVTGLTNSPAEKVQDARDKLKEARENVIKAREEVVEALKESVKNFKDQTQEKNNRNEKIIAEYRERIPAAKNELIEKYHSKIDELALKNAEMRKKLEAYKIEGKGKWVSFKHEFNHDMGGLEKALKDFTMDHEK